MVAALRPDAVSHMSSPLQYLKTPTQIGGKGSVTSAPSTVLHLQILGQMTKYVSSSHLLFLQLLSSLSLFGW